jgi:methylmalonyl-CoA/ethylmalonyl-CoA epimerase
MQPPGTGIRIPFLDERPVDQVGIVVRDLDAAVERYSARCGGPWRAYTYGPGTVPTMTFRGGPGAYTVRIALNALRPQLELLQPVAGRSIYQEWLDEHGEGLHHVGIWVDKLAEAVAAMEVRGFELLQSGAGYGLDGDGGYAYFDTRADLGMIVEAIEVPRRRRGPERVWP